MANDLKIFQVPGCSSDFEHLIDVQPPKPPPPPPPPLPPKQPYVFPSFGETFDAVCFCCFATDVPLTNAKKCRHKGFVSVYLSMIPSIPLLICNICHHMLIKIEDFRLQIENNFKALVSKKKADEKCILVNDLSRKPTISIVSIKPICITTIDPLSVSTADAEVDFHEPFVDQYLEDSRIYNEVPIIKVESDEVLNSTIPQNTIDTLDDISDGEIQHYIELTPTNIKQELQPPMPSLTCPLILQKNLNQSTFTNNNSALFEKHGKETNPIWNTSKKYLLMQPKPATKATNNYLVDLLNSVNKPLNLQHKYNKEQSVDRNINTDTGKVKDEPITARKSDLDMDECYEGKIGIIKQTEAELLKEREKERLEESFVKNKYKCESCIEIFQYELELNKHIKRFHTNKDYTLECMFCKKRYMIQNTLDRHTEKHLVRYFCLVCKKQSDNLSSLTEHYNETHKDKEPIQKKFECKDCEYVTYYKTNYYNHRHRMHKIYTCKICKQKLNGYGSYKYHMKFVHEHDDDKDVKEKGFYKCDECPASYTHFGSLKAHKKTRHVPDGLPKQVYCQPCDKFYSNKYNYNLHLQNSSKHKHENNYLKFECDHCHKKFPLKRSLKLHIERQHLNIFNHKCHICNKLCVHDQALAKHISIVHDKIRPPKTDVCHVCGKVYCSKEVLKKHMRIHTGERPYACDLCGMAFAQSSTLNTHKKLKHKIPKKHELLKENNVASSSWAI